MLSSGSMLSGNIGAMLSLLLEDLSYLFVYISLRSLDFEISLVNKQFFVARFHGVLTVVYVSQHSSESNSFIIAINQWSTTCPSKAVYVLCCGKVHVEDPLLLIGKSSPCGDSGFPLKKYVTVTICLTFSSR